MSSPGVCGVNEISKDVVDIWESEVTTAFSTYSSLIEIEEEQEDEIMIKM